MVQKQCQSCGAYFTGNLDGEYRCEVCQASGVVPRRKLASLDAASPAAIARGANVKGQAA